MKDLMTKKLTYLGAGIGLVLFAVFGLLPGSFLGGVMGVNIAGAVFGMPLSSGILARLVVAASMVLGVMLAGLIFVAGSAIAGWLAGTAIDKVRSAHEAREAEHKA